MSNLSLDAYNDVSRFHLHNSCYLFIRRQRREKIVVSQSEIFLEAISKIIFIVFLIILIIFIQMNMKN